MSLDSLAPVWALFSLLSIVIGLGIYAWYCFALSRLFPKLGAEGWKGWVPVLNEMQILERGGVPGWNIVFSFLPIVQLYGLYLKAIAVYRINESFGKGAGFTVLGIFLPPVWATLLNLSAVPQPGDYDRRVEGLLAPAAPPATDAQPLATPTAYASAPPPPRAPAVAMAFPSLASRTPEPEPQFIAAPPAPPVAPPVPAPAPVESEPGTVYTPWAQSQPTAAAPPPMAIPDDDDNDELDRTVAIDRRPVVPWRLVTDEGHVIPLRTRTVLLGRKPVSESTDIDAIAVPDATKTLSKNHARLELSDEGTWSIIDLDSTNGVIIVEPDGTETLLPRGGSARVPGRFMLGTVAMRVTFGAAEPAR